VLVASIALVVLTATALFIVINIGSKAVEEKTWRVCTATLLDPIERKPLKNFTVYWAWSSTLMREGYRYKDSYDFLNYSAVGMLFLLNSTEREVHVTMRDVKLPLHAVFYEYKPAEIVSNKTVILLHNIYGADLEPGREYWFYTLHDAMIEFNPQAYSELIQVCETTNSTYCNQLNDYYIQIDLDNCTTVK